jgi:putative flavoprotein involved in K+ transport
MEKSEGRVSAPNVARLDRASSASPREHRLIEEGEAFMALAGLDGRAPAPGAAGSRVSRLPSAPTERYDVIVIGAGQAGLSVGYHLARRGLSFLIVDASERIGDVWRKRWDSLRLFTPARFDSLDGLPFPGPRDAFPTKDQMADYLEGYAAHFALPVRSAVKIERVSKRNGRFLLSAAAQEFEADQLVIAMASFQQAKRPAFAEELDPRIVQLHSSEYQRPSQLREGAVLMVGAGNSGAEIALEVARQHTTWLAGRATGHVPFAIGGLLGRLGLTWLLLRVIFHRVLSAKTPIGRRLRAKSGSKGGPLIRIRPGELSRAGVERVGRVVGVRAGLPLLDDGRVLDVANVIWCNGFAAGLGFLDLPIFGADGKPRHDSGVVVSEPGLYFVGQHFLHAFSSTMIHGVGRDAARIADAIAVRQLSVR